MLLSLVKSCDTPEVSAPVSTVQQLAIYTLCQLFITYLVSFNETDPSFKLKAQKKCIKYSTGQVSSVENQTLTFHIEGPLSESWTFSCVQYSLEIQHGNRPFSPLSPC